MADVVIVLVEYVGSIWMQILEMPCRPALDEDIVAGILKEN